MRRLELSTGWRMRERQPGRPLEVDLADPSGWIPATVPGTVHQDLIAAGLLPDPFWATDERLVQWVGERDWLYRTAFHTPVIGDDEVVELCLDGLDTIATVWLNGVRLLDADDMFVPHRVPVGAVLRPHMNHLVVEFRAPLATARAAEAVHGRFPVWNGDPARVHLRKAQYHFGWDWGPTILTIGPWRGIRIEMHRGRIADLGCATTLAEGHGRATVEASVAIEGWTRGMTVAVELADPDGRTIARQAAPVALEPGPSAGEPGGSGTGGAAARSRLVVDAPRLWWPRGAGDQPLYRLAATLLLGKEVVDRAERRIGFRSIALVQEPVPGEPGTSFMFAVNGRPLFCGGANWIPADVFLPRIDSDRYRRWVSLAADAGMTMLRVWGGGIYEADAFYDACDESGLLVWQDFMFACGIYPAHHAFLATVQREAEVVVRRLRHHPSIALWCGNNEDYAIAADEGRYPVRPPDDRSGGAPFPGRVIYERVLPEVCHRLDPSRPYWPGSPYGGEDPNDPTVGDRHTWEVWHGDLAPYHDYPRYEGRFVSEFGMLAAPDAATIATFCPPGQRHPGSDALRWHDKADGGEARLATYLARSFPDTDDLDAWVHATQLLQAEALVSALLGWRRRWGTPGRRAVGGALVWQLDDCWPAVSWALVDHHLRPKGAYHAVRRALAPVALGMAGPPAAPEAWAMNSTDSPIRATLEVDAWGYDGNRLGGARRRVRLEPDGTTELGSAYTSSAGASSAGALATAARLIVRRRVVARAATWPASFRDLAMPDPGISLRRLGRGRVELAAARPAKGVWLDAGDGVSWGDGLIDLFPGDPQVIVAKGLGRRPLMLRWLGGTAR